MKLSELKQRVYQLTQAKTPRELKANYPTLASLDFRYKTAWQEALNVLTLLDTHSTDTYEHWLANPPPEYQELFAEIEANTQDFEEHYALATDLNVELLKIADDLDTLGLEIATEAEHLAQELETSHEIKRKAELN